MPSKRGPGRPAGSKNKPRIDQDIDSHVMLKAVELCDIIKTCSDNGVIEFNYGKINIKFNGESPVKVNATQEQFEPITPETLEADRKMFQEEQRMADLELLAIEDPAEYERIISGKESLDADSGTQPLI
jgi:hypothetical protein